MMLFCCCYSATASLLISSLSCVPAGAIPTLPPPGCWPQEINDTVVAKTLQQFLFEKLSRPQKKPHQHHSCSTNFTPALMSQQHQHHSSTTITNATPTPQYKYQWHSANSNTTATEPMPWQQPNTMATVPSPSPLYHNKPNKIAAIKHNNSLTHRLKFAYIMLL